MAQAKAFDLDDWMIGREALISFKKLHAIGWLSAQWNVCEEALHLIFAAVVGVSEEVGWAISNSLGDVTISSAILNVARTQDRPSEYIEELKYMLDIYDQCRINRNTLAHAMIGDVDGMPKLVRLVKGASRKSEPVDESLLTLRQAANDIDRLANYMLAMLTALLRFARATQGMWPQRPPLPASVSKRRLAKSPKQRR